MCLTNFIQLLKDISVIAASAIGGFVALKGLSAWKRQLYGQSKYEIAKRILKNAYLIRELINTLRFPLIECSLSPEDSALPFDSRERKRKMWQATIDVYEKRSKPLFEARTEFDFAILESEIFWDKNLYNKSRPLINNYAELISCLKQHFAMTDPDNRMQISDTDLILHIESVIYGHKDDEFAKSIERSIADIESVLKPIIKAASD